jgi:hypothetical protein
MQGLVEIHKGGQEAEGAGAREKFRPKPLLVYVWKIR